MKILCLRQYEQNHKLRSKWYVDCAGVQVKLSARICIYSRNVLQLTQSGGFYTPAESAHSLEDVLQTMQYIFKTETKERAG